jgi:ParB family chromosome partitioning protein
VKNAKENGQSTAAHISDLRPDPENRRTHNPRNVGMVVDALQRVGAARSIVIDEDGVILAGNGVVDAAAEAGIHTVQIVDSDGSSLVAVRRSGLSPEQKRDLAISDNRTAELAEWNAEQLQSDAVAGLDLSPWFSDEELAKVLSGQNVPGFAPVGADEQGRLDQKAPVTCPKCGHEF